MVLPDDPAQRAREHLAASASIKRDVAETCLSAIVAAAALLVDTFRGGGRLFLCGNGGSAADCQHMAAELVTRLSKGFERPALPAIALTTDTSLLTAYANDYGFDGVFERQVQALGRPGDALLAISTSGSSPNVLRAVAAARSNGMQAIVLCGSGGLLKDVGNVVIAVPSSNTQHIQESHLTIEHIICDLVEQALYARDGS